VMGAFFFKELLFRLPPFTTLFFCPPPPPPPPLSWEVTNDRSLKELSHDKGT